MISSTSQAAVGVDLTSLADAAFREASIQVLEIARQTGTPIVVWRDGRVVELTCEEAELELARREAEDAAKTANSSETRPSS